MKLILGSLLIAVAFAATYRHEIGYRPSLKQRLMREGKLPEYLAKKEARLAKITHLATGSQPILDFDDMAYYSFIDLGTPRQTFVVFLDSGSSTTWVPDVTCGGGSPTCGIFCKQTTRDNCLSFCRPECCPSSSKYQQLADNPCNTKNRFNQTLSSTYKSLNSPFDIFYQTGEVKGTLGQDTLCLTNSTFCIMNQGFGQASTLGADFLSQPGDGMMGLGWPSLAVNGIQPPFFSAMNQGLLDKPVYTVYMTNVGAQISQGGGQLTVGDYDQQNCGANINWVPLTSQSYWQFKMDGVASGSYSANPGSGWQAISDTASTFMGAPQAVIDGLAKVVGATYNDAFKAYFIDCDARTPDITFSINNQKYNVSAKNYILAAGPGLCQFAFFPLAGGGFAPSWMLGPPFIREWCQIHDMQSARIGLAKAIQN